MAAITKKTTIGEVLNRNLDTAKFFMEIGMHCLGCPASQGESIEEACMVHGTNADELVAKLNAFLGEYEENRSRQMLPALFFWCDNGKYDFNTAAGLPGRTGADGRAAGGYRYGSRQAAHFPAAGRAYCIRNRIGYW